MRTSGVGICAGRSRELKQLGATMKLEAGDVAEVVVEIWGR